MYALCCGNPSYSVQELGACRDPEEEKSQSAQELVEVCLQQSRLGPVAKAIKQVALAEQPPHSTSRAPWQEKQWQHVNLIRCETLRRQSMRLCLGYEKAPEMSTGVRMHQRGKYLVETKQQMLSSTPN